MPTDITLKIGGKATVMDHIDRIEFVDAIDRLQALVLHVDVPRHTDPSTVIKLFPLGKAYTVSLMRDNKAVGEAAAGDVMEVRHALRRDIGHQLTVVGLDSLHKLRGQHAAAVQLKKSHTDVVKAVAKASKLTAKVTGVGTTKMDIFEPDLLDGVAIRQIAQQYNCMAHIAGKNLVVAPVQGAGAAVSLTWPQDIIELTLDASIDALITTVLVHGYDRAQEKAFVVKALPKDLKKISGGDTGVDLAKKSFGPASLIFNQSGYFEQTTAKARAKAELQRRAERFVQGSAAIGGTPELRAGKKVTFKNLPWPLAGTFLVSESRHVLDARHGYRTFFSFISDSLPKAS